MTSQYFKFKGKVHLWKYLNNQSNYPGINLTADEDGCNSLIELLTLFNTSNHKPTKNLTLYPTTEKTASVGTPKSRFKSFNSLALNFTNDNEFIWTIEEKSNDEIRISFSPYYLNELKHAMNKVKIGEGDFLIADKKQKHILYFWWHLNN